MLMILKKGCENVIFKNESIDRKISSKKKKKKDVAKVKVDEKEKIKNDARSNTDELLNTWKTEREFKQKKGTIFKIFDKVLTKYNRHDRGLILDKKAKLLNIDDLNYHARRNALVTIITQSHLESTEDAIEKELVEDLHMTLKMCREQEDSKLKRMRNLKKIKR